MNRFIELLEKYVTPTAGRIANQRHLISIRDGIIMAMPLMIIGSVFLILANLPIPGYPEFMANLFGDSWADKLSYPVSATFDIIGLVVSFGVAFRLAERYKLDPSSVGIISLASFLLVTPHMVLFQTSAGVEETVGGVLPMALMGSQGMFVAMIIALLATEMYRIIVGKNMTIKLPSSVPPAVAKSFSSLVPGLFILSTVWILRLLIELTPWGSIHDIITTVIGKPLGYVGGSLPGTLFVVLVIQILWICGLHGDAIVGSVMSPIWLKLMDENRMAFQANSDLPNVITQQFYDIFIVPGGTGATLALVIMMIFWARSKQLKQLGKLSGGASIFNISEPVAFGLPIVLNPIFIIPFICIPLILTVVTYTAMNIGLVAAPNGVAVPWTTPIFISGYLATGSISGIVMQFVNLVIALVLYYPFFYAWDRQKVREEGPTVTKLDNNQNLNA